MHTSRQKRRARLLALGAALGLLVSACDNTVEPIVAGGESAFTVDGFLHTASDTQFVRVSAIRESAPRPTDPTLDAVVTSTDLGSGATVAWRDSLVRLDDGGTGHLFYAVFRPTAGATYRLDVRRSDGRTTSAVTRVPPAPEVRIDPPALDTLGNLTQSVLWRNATFATDMTLHYDVTDVGTGDTARVHLQYDRFGERLSQGWRVTVQLERDYRLVHARLRLPPSDSLLVLRRLGMEIEQLSPEWTDPGAAGNVTNGHGFFGAVGRFATSWSLDSTTIRQLGYL